MFLVCFVAFRSLIRTIVIDDGAVAAVVADEIEEILKGKTYKELVELEKAPSLSAVAALNN